MNKLVGLPTIHYISLEESVDRRTNLENWFQKYNVTNYVPHLFKRFEDYNYTLTGPHVDLLAHHSKGPITSHFTVLKDLYKNYDEEYFLIVEDDLSLETIEYWNFSWEQFYNNLPEDWKCIQLTIIREYKCEDFLFDTRRDYDWCAAAYLIKKDYIEYIISKYYPDEVFNLDTNFIPVIENLIFTNNTGIYNFPLFVEDCFNTKTTLDINYDHEHIYNNQGNHHHRSYNDVITWWKTKGKFITMNTKIKHIYQNKEFGENWFSYPNLYKAMVEKFPDNSKFVEIGSWKGKSSAFMAVEIANSNKKIEFYCVDTWQGGPDHKGRDDLNTLYDTFNENMKSLRDFYTPMKMNSIDATNQFDDQSLDFVFIDASHEYEDVKNDIIAWLPKIKSGGIIAGHDYYINGWDYFPGVKKAVDEIFNKNNLKFQEDCWIFEVLHNTCDYVMEFSLDTENSEKNYRLAYWYETLGHTAPAHTYYLRAAERAEDNLLAYSALIRSSFCYNQQKIRDASEKVLLENALMLLPKRPEAYYFLSQIYEKRKEWQNCYIYSTLGLNCYENNENFYNSHLPEYSGRHLLIFQKAVSSWWWGKGDESRRLFTLLYKEYWNNLTEKYKTLVMENLNKLNVSI